MANGILTGSVCPRSGRYLRSGLIALFGLATVVPSGRAEQITGPQALLRPESEAIPRFEVASIKPCKTDFGGRSGGSPRSAPGRVNLTCITLSDLIHIAYEQN